MSQHGFRPGRSCDTALATITHYISDGLDARTPTDLIQLDYSDAFDTLDHHLLIKKLAGVGVRGSMLRWVAHFLIGRSHRVVFHGSTSNDYRVPSGVPQGSVLGPTLFSIYVNDMPKRDGTLLVQYADDTTILARLDSPSSYHLLQDHLTQVVDWSIANHLRFSHAKSAAMRFSAQRRVQPPCYSMSGTPVPVATHLQILGVTLTPTLDFTIHVSSIVAKARRTLGFVTRVSRFCGPEAFRVLYTALVPPRLEYCAAIWSPHQAHLSQRLEGVQRRATRTLLARTCWPLARSQSYEYRLRGVNWHSLDHRRVVARVKLLCRLLDGSMCDTYLESVVRINRRSGQPEQLRARTLRHGHSFVPAAIEAFLAAPLDIRVPLPQDRQDSVLLCRAFSRARGNQRP
ncbi:hypothetical protein ISCGN_012890 [Ixodes scapularis]